MNQRIARGADEEGGVVGADDAGDRGDGGGVELGAVASGISVMVPLPVKLGTSGGAAGGGVPVPPWMALGT